MRTNIDPEEGDTLLDAVLGDEGWQDASTTFKQQALETFHAHQRMRALTRWAGSVAVLAAVVACGIHWLRMPATPQHRVMVASAIVPNPAPEPRRLTDAELVASFPKGSCFIAEIDGKKQLIFVDPKAEHAYLAR
jgi:hypothetical protein